MSGWTAACPACGAPITFSLGASLLKICEHCGGAVARKGADLASYGKVASLLPTPSLLALGLEGRIDGLGAFTLVGRLQLDHGAGTWDEWLMAFADGKWAWLCEAQGRFHVMREARLPQGTPAFDQIAPGQAVPLGTLTAFVATEVRKARFVSAAGELPFATAPGSSLAYADLSGPEGELGTLDYGTGTSAGALYVGREVALAALHMKNLPSAEERAKKDAGRALSCPKCGGPLELRAPDRTLRVACPWCGSLLDATQNLAVLETVEGYRVKPWLPLGSSGVLDGVRFQVIGYLNRSTTVEGDIYTWREYLLYEPAKGFRWLVESNGHWTLAASVPTAQVRVSGSHATCKETSYKHFQGSVATIDDVLGEFYWAVKRGDKTEVADYVSPPFVLSSERDAQEINWSHGRYLDPGDVARAFAVKAPPPARLGVGANQPWPRAAASAGVGRETALLLAALFAVFLLFSLGRARTVTTERFSIAPTALPASPEAILYSTPFVVDRRGNLELRAETALDNSWLYLDGALINEQTGAVDSFDLEISYYHGRDGDGSWSEGGRGATRYIATVPPGRYVIRLAPQWQAGGVPPASIDLRVRSAVVRFSQLLLAALLVLAYPLYLAVSRFRFEYRRWSESDHPWVQESS